jgi:hypothetical protein
MFAGDLIGCNDLICCSAFPCADVRHAGNVQPDLPSHAENIRVVMISTTPSPDGANPATDYADPVVRAETLAAFRAAGYDVRTVEDIRSLGVYVTTAIKCPKLGYGIKPETIANCSVLLETELAMFPNVKSILLMGNTAIKAINEIAVRRYGTPAIPTGSSYKVKGHEYRLGDVSLFPSYPESGRNLSVEGDRNEVIAVDIRNAIEVAGGPATRSHQIEPSLERHRSLEPRSREARERSA